MGRLFIKKDDWDLQATNSDNRFHQVCRTVDPIEFNELIKDIIIKLNLGDTQDSLLDVGCGNGLVLSHLKHYVRQIYGTDLSGNMINEAKHLIPEGKFYNKDAENLDFEDGLFDRVLCYSIFHYFPSLDYALNSLEEMVRVCKKGGILLIGDILDKKYEEEIKRNSDLEYEKKIPSIQRYSEWMFYDLKQLSKTFRGYGYRVEILTQPSHFKCSYYRRDLRISK